MALNQDTAGPKFTPSRPSKATILILLGIVVAFFAIVLSQGEKSMQEMKNQPPAATSTQE